MNPIVKPGRTQALTRVIGIASLAASTSCGGQAPQPGSGQRSVSASSVGSCPKYTVPDSLPSPDGRLVVRVVVADRGLRNMAITDRVTGETLLQVSHDLVNMLWVAEGRGLLFAVSPIYDKPGIYLFDTRRRETRRIVAPTNTSDPASPDGTDWFVICSLESAGRDRGIVHYLHLPNVERIDFRNFPYDAPQEVDTVWFRP